MRKAQTTSFQRLWAPVCRLLTLSLLLYSFFSLCKFLFFLSGSWMTNHSKSNLLPRTRFQASDDEIEQNAGLLFQQIEGQLTLCDIKAYLTVLADTLLILLLIFVEAQNLRSFLHPVTLLPQRLATLCILLVLFALLGSCFCAVRTVLPTLQDRDRITLMYFGHIAQLNHDKFVSNFQNQPLRELKESLLSEVYAKARIARRKLSYLTWSVVFFFSALLLWLMAQLLLLLL